MKIHLSLGIEAVGHSFENCPDSEFCSQGEVPVYISNSLCTEYRKPSLTYHLPDSVFNIGRNAF